jgi:hypothetical protein
MAQITQVRLVDDLDGGEAAESVDVIEGKVGTWKNWCPDVRRSPSAARTSPQQMGSTKAEPNGPDKKKVAYIWSQEYEQISDCLPSNIGRVPATIVATHTQLVLTNSFPHPRIQSRQTHDVLFFLES